MGAIFISYRRDDSEGHAGRLFEALVDRFGKDRVFIDVTGIEPGRDFRKVIDSKVAECSVLLAVIGSRWLEARDAAGRRRIDDPGDFVRIETASALRRDIPVVPVLVHDAKMPTADQLPTDLTDLAFRNAVELTHARWESDVQVLGDALAPHVGPIAPAPAAVTPTVVAPAGTTRAPASAPGRRGWIVVGLAALALAAGAAWWLTRSPPEDPRGADAQRREIAGLIAQAVGDDMAARRGATARLIERHGRSALAVQLAVDQLSEANFQRLSKEGRVNVLTFLVQSDTAAWSDASRGQSQGSVRRIRERLAGGSATLGPQVTDLLGKLGEKLGQRDPPDPPAAGKKAAS
jgi:hypothetical protein